MEYAHGQIVEYGTYTDADRSTVTRIDSAVFDRREYVLKHHTPGFECAGSCARYNGNEVWSVTFQSAGATHGRRFLKESDARDLFAKWTTPETV